MQAQRKRPLSANPRPASRPEYIAAVRHRDGRREMFCVRNALSLDDARELVAIELVDFQSIVVAARR